MQQVSNFAWAGEIPVIEDFICQWGRTYVISGIIPHENTVLKRREYLGWSRESSSEVAL